MRCLLLCRCHLLHLLEQHCLLLGRQSLELLLHFELADTFLHDSFLPPRLVELGLGGLNLTLLAVIANVVVDVVQRVQSHTKTKGTKQGIVSVTESSSVHRRRHNGRSWPDDRGGRRRPHRRTRCRTRWSPVGGASPGTAATSTSEYLRGRIEKIRRIDVTKGDSWFAKGGVRQKECRSNERGSDFAKIVHWLLRLLLLLCRCYHFRTAVVDVVLVVAGKSRNLVGANHTEKRDWQKELHCFS